MAVHGSSVAKVIRPTFKSPLTASYLAAGGAWSGPTVDELLASCDGFEQVARIAGGLVAIGVTPGAVVTWQSPNRSAVALAYRACWRVGAIAAPLHHQLGTSETGSLLSALGEHTKLDLDLLPTGTPVEKLWSDNSAVAAVLFTSGSTGTPKGVLHTQATLGYKATTMRDVHRITPNDVVLMPAPCAHISGLLNGITMPGVAGARTVYMAKWNPEAAVELIEKEHVTFMIGPPTFFISLMGASNFSASRVASLRLISSGGAGVTPAFVESTRTSLNARVKRTYGSTEAPSVATNAANDDAHDESHDGRAIGQAELRISPEGELLVRGPEVCVGYLDAKQNDAAFDSEGWFHTGDLATLDHDGWLNITGRLHDMIIRGGENIAAIAVEAVLEAHPNVQLAAVVGIPDERLGESICAFVVADTGFDLDVCRDWFEARGIARWKTPERVIVMESLPMLASGKTDKAGLKRIALG